MALKKNQTNPTAPHVAAEFEDVNDTVATAEAERGAPWEEQAATVAAERPQAQAREATTAASSTSAVAVAAKKAQDFKRELEEMRDAISFDYGTLANYKATNGAIRETGNGTRSFGEWVQGRLMAYGAFWQVSPGGSDTKLKGFVAFSKDGKTVDHVIGDGAERSFVGKPVVDYLDYLRNTEGLDKADSKPYLNMAILVTSSARGEKSEVEVGETVNLVLSSSSIRSFTAYEEKLKLATRAMQMGLPSKALPDDPFMLRFTATEAQSNGNRWTKIDVEPAQG